MGGELTARGACEMRYVGEGRRERRWTWKVCSQGMARLDV